MRAYAFRTVLLMSTTCLVLSSEPAAAHHQSVHSWAEGSLTQDGTELRPATPSTLDDLRLYLYRVWSSSPVMGREFRAMYPTPESFTKERFKEFLGLSRTHRVYGIDVPPPAGTEGGITAWAAAEPDEGMNQDAFLYDEQGRVVTDRWGRPIPWDPASVQMGGLRGLASQAYAHYQLCPGPKTDDFAILKSAPERFAKPPDVRTFAAHFAQLFSDLSFVAAHARIEGGAHLAAVFRGYAHHFMLDGADHFHTVQVGSYSFFVSAFWQSVRLNLLSFGGILFDTPDLVDIGVNIISNHHLLGENLFAAWLDGIVPRPGITDRALEALRTGDARLRKRLAMAGCPAPNKECAFQGVLLASSESCPEAREAYELVSALAREEIFEWGVDVPDDLGAVQKYLKHPMPGDAARRFEELMVASLARFATVARVVDSSYHGLGDGDASRIAERLGLRLMSVYKDVQARRSAYRPSPPRARRINWWYPAGELALLDLLLFAVIVVRLRLRRRSREG